MVLIPGMVLDWSMYEAFMERNGDKYTMYAVTLPGFAKSEPPAAPAAGASFTEGAWMANAERAIMAMIEEKKLDKPVIVGQSFGGHMALRLAARHPDAFRSAVIINSVPALTLSAAPTMSMEDRKKMVDQQMAAFIANASDEEWNKQQTDWLSTSVKDKDRAAALVAVANQTPKAISSRYMLEYLGSDISGEVGSLTAPLLAVVGQPVREQDAKVVADMWQNAYGKAPKATIVFFEGNGEFITEESPAELDRAIDQFLTGKPVEGRKAPKLAPPPGQTPAAEPKGEAPPPSSPPAQAPAPVPQPAPSGPAQPAAPTGAPK
jgi:pimeloyl-ACP methyl ester carboxylesterase